MPTPSAFSTRIYAGGFAAILILQSAWLLAAEITRPTLPFFPTNVAEARAAATQHSAAAITARIGWPRGDLWIDYAIAANATRLAKIESGVTPLAVHARDTSSGIVVTAATLAPSDARAWLLLASTTAESDKMAALLKMSYYTAPYSERLFPLRIQVVARSPAPFDEELGGYIDYELGMIVRHKPGLKPAVALAFHVASPTGRHFLTASISKLDPNFLSKLQTANQ